MKSDDVLKKISKNLERLGFKVEKDKRNPVNLEIKNDSKKELKEFRVDAKNEGKGIIIEVEAGRAVANYQFLKDIMECAMFSARWNSKQYLVIAVRNLYVINNAKDDKHKHNSHDYINVKKWLDTIEFSGLDLNLKGILLIGY